MTLDLATQIERLRRDVARLRQTTAGGGALTDGDKGDITVSASGLSWVIDNSAVNTSKLGGDITSLGKVLLQTSSTMTGFWPDVDALTLIGRFPNRLFIGSAYDATGNFSGTQTAWPATNAAGANWVLRDAQVSVANPRGLIALAGFSRASLQSGSPPTECIGVAGVVDADGTSPVWAFYGDVHWRSGSVSYGLELANKNLNQEVTADAYATSTGGGMFGIHINTGDPTYGGVPLYNGTAAINIAKGMNVLNTTTWNLGIRFTANALTRDINGRATAMAMGQKTGVKWYVGTGIIGSELRSDVNSSGADTSLVFENNQLALYGTNGNFVLRAVHVASGENNLVLKNAAVGSYPTLQMEGTDTDIGIFHISKGSAPHRFFNGSLANEDLRVGGAVAAPVNFLHIYGREVGASPAIVAAGAGVDLNVTVIPKGAGVLRVNGPVTATGAATASNLSGTNTGDETGAGILTKIAAAPGGGGTTNFVRADGTFAVPSGGSGSTLVAEITVNFATAKTGAFFDVAVTGALTSQKVTATPSLNMPAGVAEDELEMDPLVVHGVVKSADLVRLFVGAANGRGIIGGSRNIQLHLA